MALGFNPFEKDKAAPIPKTKKTYSRHRVFDHPDVIPAKPTPTPPPALAPVPTPPKATKRELITLEPSELVLSAIKKSKHGGTTIVRYYNPTQETKQVRLHLSQKLQQAWLVTLSEERINSLQSVTDNTITHTIKPQALVCMELSFL